MRGYVTIKKKKKNSSFFSHKLSVGYCVTLQWGTGYIVVHRYPDARQHQANAAHNTELEKSGRPIDSGLPVPPYIDVYGKVPR